MPLTAESLLVFVKHPEPGRVKTRLAPLLGERLAARVYRRLAVHTLEVATASLPRHRSVRVWVEPAARAADVPAWLGPADAFLPQPEGDLGARMARAFGEAFEGDSERVVIVGSDVPCLEPADLEAAFDALSSRDAVLGPAADGGYWLLGLRRLPPGLFDSIPWSSPDVLPVTRTRLERLRLTWIELRELRDVDRPDDFIALADAIPRGDIDRWSACRREGERR